MTISRNILSSLFCVGLLASVASVAHANTFTFKTPTGSTTSGGAVNATATVTTGAGTIEVILTDMLGNPANVAQVLSDFDFVLSSGQTSGTLTSQSGQLIQINGDNSSTLISGAPTGWELNNNVSGGLQLDALGGGQPKDLIIGTGPYSNANNSIAGNGPHNPFIDGTATFDLSVLGVTSTTSISSVTFSFGTTPCSQDSSLCVSGTPAPNPTPEPSSLLLLGTGILGAAGLLHRRMAPGQNNRV